MFEITSRIEHRYNNCSVCDLSKLNSNKYKGQTIRNVPIIKSGTGKILLVTDTPSKYIYKTFYNAETTTFLNIILSKFNLYDDISVASILACNPSNPGQPMNYELKQCEHNIKFTIKLLQPKVIILLGMTATKFYMGQVKFTDIINNLIVKNDIIYIPTFSPAFIDDNGRFINSSLYHTVMLTFALAKSLLTDDITFKNNFEQNDAEFTSTLF